MKLNEQGLADAAPWQAAGYSLPRFDREQVTRATKEAPTWIHFGNGNIFRALHANMAQMLLNEGIMKTGIIVAGGRQAVDKISRPRDDYHILVTLKATGEIEKTVIGSVVESIVLDARAGEEWQRLAEIFASASLQMASFTITEKGYALKDGKGEWLTEVQEDFTRAPAEATAYMGQVASLLYSRYLAGGAPIAMVSMDNCSHNGDRLKEAILAYAEEWVKNNLVEKEFLIYVRDGEDVSFPCTMIDKITPRPDEAIEEMLQKDGIENLDRVITSRSSYLAPYVNAEECEYLIIEDDFPNGRPPLEHAGVIFTDKETVDKVEKMKVCTCLNPLHTALAVFGCLLGFDKISEEMQDDDLRRLVERIGYEEGLPVVVDPGILDPEKFLDTVLNVRFPNPFMPDTPQRIATDTSQKLSVRFGETIRAYAGREGCKPEKLKLIPLVFAGWLRYLTAVDDQGEEFILSPDPLLPMLLSVMQQLEETEDVENVEEEILKPILANQTIFGVDLYEVGLAHTVCGYFREMQAGKGAVRATLKKYVQHTV